MMLAYEKNATEFDGSECSMSVSYVENRTTTPDDFESITFNTTTRYADPGEFSGGLNLICDSKIIGYLFWTDYDESRRFVFQKLKEMQYTVHEISDKDLLDAITEYDVAQ